MRALLRAALAVCALPIAACGGDASLDMRYPKEEVVVEDFTFRGGVIPILEEKPCTNCHIGDSPLSGLNLDASDPDTLHDRLMAGGTRETTSAGAEEVVDLDSPAASLLLTAPLPGSSFNHQSQKYFANEDDPAYLTIKGWIELGAFND